MPVTVGLRCQKFFACLVGCFARLYEADDGLPRFLSIAQTLEVLGCELAPSTKLADKPTSRHDVKPLPLLAPALTSTQIDVV